jgi:thioredoxin reductase
LANTPALRDHIRLNCNVSAVTRLGIDKLKNRDRENAPFVVRVNTKNGEEEILAQAVIDASGTWRNPNPLGAGGIPAMGERALESQLYYGIPDVLSKHRERYAGKRVLVVGSGHSAFNALLDLMQLATHVPGTHITWAVRRDTVGQMFGGGANDALSERGALGMKVQQLIDEGKVDFQTGVRIHQLRKHGEQIQVFIESPNEFNLNQQRELGVFDEIVVATGFRPDLSMLSELRLAIDEQVEAPKALAPLIDPNIHSCGSVPPHGVDELSHPERDFYIVGMKSYGRAPTFLMLTGYEQVRSIAAALAGDWKTAREVQLELPETGVCCLPTDLSSSESCCGTNTAQSPQKSDLIGIESLFTSPNLATTVPILTTLSAQPIKMAVVSERTCCDDTCCTSADNKLSSTACCDTTCCG